MRPTKYTKELCQKLIELMYEGMSIEEVCYELKICKQTFYNWCDKYPEFLDSKKKGEDFSKGWWLKQGRVNLENKDFSATLFYMNMKNRFGWADKREDKVQHSGSIEQKTVDLNALESNDLEKLLEIKKKLGE